MANKEIIKEWTILAKEDVDLAAHLIEEKWFYRAALAHLQQAIEKYTKAFLISRSWELRRIHDLETLFAEGMQYEPFFKDYVNFGRELTAYYTETRYPPLDDHEPSQKDATRLLQKSKEFIGKIERFL